MPPAAGPMRSSGVGWRIASMKRKIATCAAKTSPSAAMICAYGPVPTSGAHARGADQSLSRLVGGSSGVRTIVCGGDDAQQDGGADEALDQDERHHRRPHQHLRTAKREEIEVAGEA